MKTKSALLLLALVLSASAAPTDRSAVFRRLTESGEKTWAVALEPEEHNPGMNTFFSYALALCEAGKHPERLEKLMERSLQLQVRDPQSPNYGTFRWNWNDQAPKDPNAIEFTMQPAAILWLRHRDTMPPAARRRLHEILDPAAVTASLRHHVRASYTNIALMSAGNLIVLGEGLNRADVADEGYKRLQEIFDLWARVGITEYLSPTYYGTDLNALQLMHAFIQRPAGQRQARALLEYIWTEVAANFWWGNLKLCGPHSRDYDYLHGLGGLDRHLAAAGFIPSDGEEGFVHAYARWQPTAEMVTMSKSKLPRLVRRGPYTHWLDRDVTLGTAKSDWGVMNVPLTVDFPGSRDDVRCYFIPDGRHDPYGKAKVPTGGHAKTVHLRPHFAGVQETQDALALAVYRDEDVPPGTKTLESHFVMPRKVDATYVGEQRVSFAPGAPKTVPVRPDEAVFLRKGTAAMGVRAPSARALDGKAAPLALIWDDNEWDAIRLTVDHRQSERPAKANAAVALHVRVGSELDDTAFAAFRHAFTAAKSEVSLESARISVQSPTISAGRTLAIVSEAPWTKPSRLQPAPSSAVLEIDGHDVGRRLFDTAR